MSVEGADEPASAEAGEAPEHEPLRQQEERRGEHAGRGPADGQRLAAEGRDGAGARVQLLRPPHRSHQHLSHPTDHGGSHAHLHRYIWVQYFCFKLPEGISLDFLKFCNRKKENCSGLTQV